jgi:hypothetical protein
MKLNETCKNCGLKCTSKERVKDSLGRVGYADPCMGILPGVLFACCGHGRKSGYIFFENGVTVRFDSLETVEQKRFSKYHVFNDETER